MSARPNVAKLLSIRRAFLQTRCINVRPAPPPLPQAEQKEFEELVKRKMTPMASSSSSASAGGESEPQQEFHPDIRRGPPPEFQGDRNPKTGEVGGPKTEPVKWNEWSYGGRATDF